jgi:hypothetical protein
LRKPDVRSVAEVRLPQFGQMNKWAIRCVRVAPTLNGRYGPNG